MMTATKPSSVIKWRKHQQQQGLVRVEVRVRNEDALLVRDVVTALLDPERESETRAILRERIATPRSAGLKALLASAPLEGINLERQRDFGREAGP